MTITGEQVKNAMMSENINRVECHDCSICGYKTNYNRQEENLYFDSGCYCTYSGSGGSGGEPRPWEDAAAWINMQSSIDHKKDIMTRFGFKDIN